MVIIFLWSLYRVAFFLVTPTRLFMLFKVRFASVRFDHLFCIFYTLMILSKVWLHVFFLFRSFCFHWNSPLLFFIRSITHVNSYIFMLHVHVFFFSSDRWLTNPCGRSHISYIQYIKSHSPFLSPFAIWCNFSIVYYVITNAFTLSLTRCLNFHAVIIFYPNVNCIFRVIFKLSRVFRFET